MEKIPPEIQAYIFKDYYAQRCISKNLNHYNYHHYLDYFDKTPISKNEVERYFRQKPNYMIIFNENLFYIYEKLAYKYIVYAYELIIDDDLSKVEMSVEILEPNIQEHQHLDLSTTFHILSKRLGIRERKRITDYVLKIYNQYVYDIEINNIDDYQLLCKMIHYTHLNIEMLSCDQSIDYDPNLEEIMFYKGQLKIEKKLKIIIVIILNAENCYYIKLTNFYFNWVLTFIS